MIKLIFCLHRLPSFSPQAFRDYWWNTHAPLVRDRAQTLRVVRYVQSHGIESPFDAGMQSSRDAQSPYDGVAELYWNNEDDLNFAMTDEAALKAGAELLEDEAKFIDLKRCSLTFVRERPVVG